MHIRSLKFAAPLSMYFLSFYAFMHTGWTIALPLMYAFMFIPLVELVFPAAAGNLSEAEEQVAKNAKTGLISSFDILSQIFPPLSLKRIPDDVRKLGSDAIKTSKKVVEIKNGVYLRGELVKSVLGEGTNGILHRINNDFGSDAVSNFIDNLQSIIMVNDYATQTCEFHE